MLISSCYALDCRQERGPSLSCTLRRVSARTARQVQAFGKAGKREIPVRVIRSRWNPRGLVERAVLGDLAAAKLLGLQMAGVD
jgi:hypothetical protein